MVDGKYKEGVMVVIRKDGKFLLGKVGKESPIHGKWGLLGGKVEPTETIEHTVKREIFEEAGISVKVVKKLFETQGTFSTLIIHIFLADFASGELVRNKRELSELGYFSYEEALKLDLASLTRKVFEEHKSEIISHF